MQRTGIGWLSWDLTHSASWVGAIALAQYLPLIIFGPIFGVMLDRSDHRRYAMLVQSTLCVLGLALFALQHLRLLNAYVLLGVCLVLGFANCAYQTVRLTLVYDVVPRELLTQAIGTNSMLFNTSRLLGPALGGIAIASLGVASTFLICAVTYMANVVGLSSLSVRNSPRREHTGSLMTQFAEGLRYTLENPLVRELLLLSVITATMARGVLELLPAFAGGEFGGGSGALAMLMAAAGAGAIVAGYLLSRAHEDKLPVLVRHGCTWSGALVSIFGSITFLSGAVVAIVALGTLVTLSSVGLQAILQAKIDNNYRGRVVGFWGVTNVAGPSVGGAVLGGIAHFAGLRTATFGSGVLCALLCYVVMRRSSQFSRVPVTQ